MAHILLIDDEGPMVHLVKRYLELNGFSVQLAFDSLTALEIVKNKPILAVVTDMEMPGLHGRELMPQLRSFSPQLPALILSGYTRNFTWDMDEQTKMLSKPVDMDELVSALCGMLNRTTV